MYMYYILWPLASVEYKLHISNMVSELYVTARRNSCSFFSQIPSLQIDRPPPVGPSLGRRCQSSGGLPCHLRPSPSPSSPAAAVPVVFGRRRPYLCTPRLGLPLPSHRRLLLASPSPVPARAAAARHSSGCCCWPLVPPPPPLLGPPLVPPLPASPQPASSRAASGSTVELVARSG
jgi:hypothetical protein